MFNQFKPYGEKFLRTTKQPAAINHILQSYQNVNNVFIYLQQLSNQSQNQAKLSQAPS